MIIFNSEISKLLGGVDGGLDIKNLYFLYLGLFFTGLASGCYQLRCPAVVKRYADEDEYVSVVGSLMTASDLSQLLSRMIPPARSGVLKIDVEMLKQRLSMAGGDEAALRIEIMKVFYKDQTKVRPFARWAASISYLLGIVLLAIPACWMFARVVSRLIS